MKRINWILVALLGLVTVVSIIITLTGPTPITDLRMVICHYATVEIKVKDGQSVLVQDDPKIIEHIMHKDGVATFIAQQIKRNNDPEVWGDVPALVRVRGSRVAMVERDGVDHMEANDWQCLWSIYDNQTINEYVEP